MEIKIFAEAERRIYSDFLLNSKYKDILQSWEWGKVKSRFNWRVERIGFFENGKLEGIAQIMKRKLPLNFGLFYIPRGPVIEWENIGLVKEVIDSLLDFIGKKKDKNILFFRLEPPAKENENLAGLFRENGFVRYFKTVQPPATLLIDLDRTEEELFKKFRRTARNLIYRSQKEGVLVQPLDYKKITAGELRDFYNIYQLTGKRFSFPLRPYKQFEFLLREMGPNDMIRLYLAKTKGITLAYGMVLVLKDKAFYIWGGSARHPYYSKFFSYGYIWGMLSDLKKRGVKTFDFWGLGPIDNKKHPWFGFSLFKTAFDGERFDYPGAYDLPLSKLYPVFKTIDRIITPGYRATSS